jgi:predicted AAA+ superfamily ATPase
MHNHVPRTRRLEAFSDALDEFPAVALLGPRQVGKTTLARDLIAGDPAEAVFLDLERPSDLARLADPEAYFERHRHQRIVLDEVQRRPDLFPVLRAEIDADRRPGRFVLLGSASPALLRQSNETLAGRLTTLEVTPLDRSEVVDTGRVAESTLHLRGGFPDSLLAADDAASLRWRQAFIASFLERDLPQLGFRVPAATLSRFWVMCAHLQGQVVNLTALGRALGAAHTTVRHYVDILEQTFVLRALAPLEANLGKRLVKTPKLYVRDAGLVHALLDLETADDLAGHPVCGASWEGYVVEQVCTLAPGWRPSFFRTATGEELDLVLERRGRRVAIECKASRAPSVERGFWRSLELLSIDEAYVVAPVTEGWPLGRGAHVASVGEVVRQLSGGTT